MLNKLSIYIVEQLISTHWILESDKEVYIYGGFIVLSNLFYLSTAILFGLIFHCIVQMLVFIVSLFFLRSYAGGYHANTEIICEIITIVMLFFIAMSIRLSTQKVNAALLIISIISILIILILAPLTSSAKPMKDKEIKRNKIITLFIVISISVIISISRIWRIDIILVPCCLSVIIESLSLFCGKIKEIIIGGK